MADSTAASEHRSSTDSPADDRPHTRQDGGAEAGQGHAGGHSRGVDHAGGVGHGHSFAAWAAVGTVVLGSLIGTIAVILALVWLFVVAVVIVAAGPVLGKVLNGMGYGEDAHERAPADPKQGVR